MKAKIQDNFFQEAKRNMAAVINHSWLPSQHQWPAAIAVINTKLPGKTGWVQYCTFHQTRNGQVITEEMFSI